jgi:hypothetical protein
MNSYYKNEFIEKIREQMMSVLLPIFQRSQKIMLFLETAQKPPKKLLLETPDPLQQSLSRFKDRFISITSNR